MGSEVNDEVGSYAGIIVGSEMGRRKRKLIACWNKASKDFTLFLSLTTELYLYQLFESLHIFSTFCKLTVLNVITYYRFCFVFLH